MNIDTYIFSEFVKSGYCSNLASNLNFEVKDEMIKLSLNGKFGNYAARVISPFVGLGTLLASLCLRVGSIVEPIIGILVDICVAIAFRNSRPLYSCILRFGHIFRNLCYNTGYIVRDVIKIGLVAGIGGILAPEAAYNGLSRFHRGS